MNTTSGLQGHFDRRTLLISMGVGGSAFIAGCTGSDDGSDQNNGGNADNGGDNGSADPNVQVVSTDLFEVTDDDHGQDQTWSEVKLENPTETIHRDVRVELRFRDSNGEIVDTWEYFTALLPAETTLQTYARHSFGVTEIDDIDYLITDQERGIRGEFSDEFDVMNKSISMEGSVVRATGELELENSYDDITIVPLVYNEEGDFVGAFRIVDSNTSGETVAFSGGLSIFDTPPDRPQPDEAEIVVAHPYL